MFDKNIPYNDLPLLPPDSDIESKKILKAAISANRALGELKRAVKILPNQSILIDCLVLLEAKDSSEIEQIFTTHDKLYQAKALNKYTDPHTKEVGNYKSALWHGMKLISKKPLCTNTIVEIMQHIREGNYDIRKTPGTKISAQNGEIIYTPPETYELLAKLLGNLEFFINDADDIDPLIKMAVMHYQFEAIHPFTDGNGRTGRILNILYLIQENLLDVPVLFLSNYIIRNKTKYYDGLRKITENQEWEEWILYMLEAVEKTSYETLIKIDAIRQAMQDCKSIMREKFPKYSKDLLEVLFEQPYCRIKSLEEKGIAKRVTASSYLNDLCELGIVEKTKVGRDVIFLNKSLWSILSS